MNSLDPQCNELKQKYDSCFNLWFTEKFLKGDTKDDMCKPLFVLYRDCVREAIKKQNIDLGGEFIGKFGSLRLTVPSLDEIEKVVLGSSEEKQPPPPNNDNKDT